MKMREININIEGFNVNGICVGCLNYNRKMYHSHRDELGDFLKSLCNIEVPSGILLQICWECQAHLTNVMKFRKQVLKSYDALLEYSRQKTFLNSPTDFIRQATSRLTISKVDRDDIYPEIEGNKFEDECSMADNKNDFKSETEDFDVNVGDRNNIHPQIEVNKLEDACSMADNRNVIKSETEDFDADDVVVAGGCTRHATSRTTKLNLYPQNEVNKCSMVDNKNGFKSETDDVDVIGVHEEPIKDETDSSEALINILPNGKNRKVVPTKRKKKLRKKRRSSKDETDQLKSAITTIHLTEEELQKERQDFSINTEFKNADFKCQNCLISFKSKEGLDEHNLVNHCLSGDYTCTVCSSVFSSRRLHKDHSKLHFTRYECSLCGKRWRLDGDEVVSSEQLEAHVTTDHRCHVCGAVYLSKEDQHKHTCSKSRIKCPLCERTFSHRAGLMNHRMAMHEAKVEYSCKTCGKKFRWKNSLKRHMEKHDQKSSAQAPAAYCETCRISFNYICSYQRHLRNSLKHVTHDQLRFICDHCNRKFADKTKLRYHIEEKHLHKTYLCEFCFKPSKNRSHLEQHIRNVHIGRPNNKMCNHCGKGFPTKVQLECHIRSHTGERPFICEYCPTTFTQQSNLYKHKRQVHLNIKSKRYPTQKKKKEDVNQPPTTDQCLITWT